MIPAESQFLSSGSGSRLNRTSSATTRNSERLTGSNKTSGTGIDLLTGSPSSEGAPVMAQARMPESFFKLAAHHLPPEQPVGREGGRPCLDHRVVLKVLWFVLTT